MILALLLFFVVGTTAGYKPFEGDMILTRGQVETAYTKELADSISEYWDDEHSSTRRVLGGRSSGLWRDHYNSTSGRFMIPYRFPGSWGGLTSTMTQSNRDYVESMMRELETQIPHITFITRTTESYFLEIGRYESGCWSYVGKIINGGQGVNLGESWCYTKGVVKHELIHALGFYHEQSRPDRDTYVSINLNNVNSQYHTNFEKRSTSEIDYNGQTYDYNSVMHYGEYAFSNNGQKTIETIPSGIPIGQRDDVSAGDVVQLRLKYRCQNSADGTLANTCQCKPCDSEFGLCSQNSHCISGYQCNLSNSTCIQIPPTASPTTTPTGTPTTGTPTGTPTRAPTRAPTRIPTKSPLPGNQTHAPTPGPTQTPTGTPTTGTPTQTPTSSPSATPTKRPTNFPTPQPTKYPTTVAPTPESTQIWENDTNLLYAGGGLLVVSLVVYPVVSSVLKWMCSSRRRNDDDTTTKSEVIFLDFH